MSDDLVEMEMPRWMVRQMLGDAIQSKHTAYTESGRDDADQIARLLRFYLEESSTNHEPSPGRR
ncbi:hypothetical protein HUG10_20960 (plasmid) [Halorarum halophilum]|uniref:Uncharacterized protein n=1 Tax=Halorarum halophilum TaxID=2743090 RepID=A0A7D5KYK5_9EURY|nr:hypothetical protein [Halobaculum halophilum]QLG30058.1 hypothetical protein HUG10_20960 [Halobaculum halophilum]